MARNRHDFGMAMAVEAASHSPLRVRVGAYASHTLAHNERKTHPQLIVWGYPEWANLHAEASLAVTLGFVGLFGQWVYVARLNRQGEWALAKPCPWCMTLLLEAGVKGVRWTAGPGKIEEVKL